MDGNTGVCQFIEPTNDRDQLTNALETWSHWGGDDEPEAVEVCLYKLCKPTINISHAFLILDAPPHALVNVNDRALNRHLGDDYKTEQQIETRYHHSHGLLKLCEKRISLHTLVCNEAGYSTELWSAIAGSLTGGLSVYMKEACPDAFKSFSCGLSDFLYDEKDVLKTILERNQDLGGSFNPELLESTILSEEDYRSLILEYKSKLGNPYNYQILCPPKAIQCNLLEVARSTNSDYTRKYLKSLMTTCMIAEQQPDRASAIKKVESQRPGNAFEIKDKYSLEDYYSLARKKNDDANIEKLKEDCILATSNVGTRFALLYDSAQNDPRTSL